MEWFQDRVLTGHQGPRYVNQAGEPAAAPLAWPTRPTALPHFPVFKPLALSDRREIETLVAGLPPYSDFNFVSLWCWNTNGQVEVSRFGANLVVRFKEYDSDELFLSFHGVSNVAATVRALLEYSDTGEMPAQLRLVPAEAIAAANLRGIAKVVEDPTANDYVLSTREWMTLAGGKFRNKRNEIAGFVRQHAPQIVPLDPRSPAVQRDLDLLFEEWTEARERAGMASAVNEAQALRRLFTLDDVSALVCLGVVVGGEMRGFSINELVTGGYAVGHFWKADHTLHGIYPYLLRATCRALAGRGYQFLNIEQDLGQSGLAYAKRLYRPCHYLRKFTLTPAATAGTDWLVLPSPTTDGADAALMAADD